MKFDPKIKYTSVCVDGKPMVLDTRSMEHFRRVENGFIFISGKQNCFTPYIMQSEDLLALQEHRATVERNFKTIIKNSETETTEED